MTEHTTDVVVLGGGSGGYAAAIRAAELGMSVVLIEEDKVGGTCLHRGCIPTKALLHAGEVADTVRSAAKTGIQAVFGGVEPAAVHGYKDAVVGRLYAGLQGLLGAHGIEIVSGRGRFAGPSSVQVGGDRYTGEHVVLATGSRPRSLPGIDIRDNVVCSDQALTLDFIPEDAIVLGGGVIGVEFASIWASLGAKVTVLEALDRLLPSEDEFSSKQLARAFRRRGITAKTGVTVDGVKQDDDGVIVDLGSGSTLEAEVLLVAVGRDPNTVDAGFAEGGIELDRGFVRTDQRLRTTVPNVYAVGDIVAGLSLAHRGFQHGIFVAEEIAGLRPEPIDEASIPRVTYSHPEVASVGLTESRAQQMYGDGVRSVVYDLAGNGKSQILGTAGAVKLVQDPGGRVAGVHMVGDRVSELIGEAQVLYGLGAAVADAARLVHAHPTQGEALGEALLALAGSPLHVHR
jgi:dihydrolipoamide dehydrogenase